MELVIVEKNGWSKPVKIDKGVIRLGSAPSNDIQLPSPQIAPIHIQILYSAEKASSCKVVNLAHELSARVSHKALQFPPRTTMDVYDGDEILLGDYTIVFRLPLSANVIQSGIMVQASLSFMDAVLKPGFATIGVLTVKNAGGKSACQFQVDLNGLPEDCFKIDPIPLMYPGAQEEVRIQLFHQTLYPPAGLQTITLKVSAPESYPGDELMIQQGVYVSPVFKQAFDLIDDLKLQEQAKVSKSAAESAGQIQPPIVEEPKSRSGISEPALVSEIELAESSVPVAPIPQEAPDLPAQKTAAGAASQPASNTSNVRLVRVAENEDSPRIPMTSVPAAIETETPAASSQIEIGSSNPAVQKKVLSAAPHQPVPNMSNVKIVRAVNGHDEDLLPAPVETSAAAQPKPPPPKFQTEPDVPSHTAQKQVLSAASQPTPNMSNVKVVRALMDENDDSTPAPVAIPAAPVLESSVASLPEQEPKHTAQKQIMPMISRSNPDVSKLKVMREATDADNFWDNE